MALLKLLNIQGIIGIAAGALLALLLGLQVHKTHHEHAAAVKYEAAYKNEHSAFLQTIVNYSNEAQAAREADAANVKRVLGEQSAINQERTHSYEARIADARARAERLRHDVPAAHQGGPGTAPVSNLRGPAGGLNGPTPEAGLSPPDQLTATEQAIQLDELIKWVGGQVRINVGNK